MDRDCGSEDIGALLAKVSPILCSPDILDFNHHKGFAFALESNKLE